MAAPVPLPVRQAMRCRWEHGATTTELSQDFGVPARTVRGLVKRWREAPEAGVAPAYRRLPDPPPPPAHPAYAKAILLRQAHPRWGAGLIRVYLKRQGVEPLPAERTLNRWFRRAGLGPAPPGRRPVSESRRAGAPHETWQVDAAEEIALADGTRVSWVRVADEFTGAVLHTAVFPPRAVERGTGGVHPGPAPRGVPAVGTAGLGAGG